MILVGNKAYKKIIKAPESGDIIQSQNIRVVVDKVLDKSDGGIGRRECEFYDKYGNYHSWREWHDGGHVYRESSKVSRKEEFPQLIYTRYTNNYVFVYETRIREGKTEVLCGDYEYGVVGNIRWCKLHNRDYGRYIIRNNEEIPWSAFKEAQ